MKEYPTSYTSLVILTSGIYACGPNRFGGTCIFSVLFKDQLEQGIFESDNFQCLREKNLEQQAVLLRRLMQLVNKRKKEKKHSA